MVWYLEFFQVIGIIMMGVGAVWNNSALTIFGGVMYYIHWKEASQEQDSTKVQK